MQDVLRPYAFTEQGVAMLSSVLRGERARLQRVKKGLMNDLLTGKKRVTI